MTWAGQIFCIPESLWQGVIATNVIVSDPSCDLYLIRYFSTQTYYLTESQ